MLRSMTGFGNAEKHHAKGSLSVDIRSVNNRFLDIQVRLPDALRSLEPAIRQVIQSHIQRGKVEVRVHLQLASASSLSVEALRTLQKQVTEIQAIFPNTPPPSLGEILQWSEQSVATTPDDWSEICLLAVQEACVQLIAHSRREGQHLQDALLVISQKMQNILDAVEQQLPLILQNYQQKISQKLQDSITQAFPQGLQSISSTALFERIQQESSLFTIRIDITEEITRLRSHVSELHRLLSQKNSSIGKRLDFVLQEMQREANTLGSKSADISTTEAAIELKVCIEQVREQIQNIE